jgi:hypothetical protein
LKLWEVDLETHLLELLSRLRGNSLSKQEVLKSVRTVVAIQLFIHFDSSRTRMENSHACEQNNHSCILITTAFA